MRDMVNHFSTKAFKTGYWHQLGDELFDLNDVRRIESYDKSNIKFMRGVYASPYCIDIEFIRIYLRKDAHRAYLVHCYNYRKERDDELLKLSHKFAMVQQAREADMKSFNS
jgi:hypothetical protein